MNHDSDANGGYWFIGEFVDELELPPGTRCSRAESFGPSIIFSIIDTWGGNDTAEGPTEPTPDEG
jgi:hypothetical protein